MRTVVLLAHVIRSAFKSDFLFCAGISCLTPSKPPVLLHISASFIVTILVSAQWKIFMCC